MLPLDRPRAPAAPLGAALYESHYLTAASPDGGRAIWVRHTALKRPGQPAHPTAWLTLFDGSAPAPRALRVTAAEPVADPGESWWRCSLGDIGPGRAHGEIGEPGGSWDLAWQPRAGALPYLPAPWLYDRPFPRSGGAALMPAGTTDGRVVLDGEQVIIAGWEAMVGHNWGSDHAHRWCWLHAGGLGDDGLGWLDLVLVRIRLGPAVTPWIASGALALAGRRWAPAPMRRVTCARSEERTSVAVSLSPRAALDLSIVAPRHATQTWDYAAPRGPGRLVDNCCVADLRLRLTSRGFTADLSATGVAAVEHGGPA